MNGMPEFLRPCVDSDLFKGPLAGISLEFNHEEPAVWHQHDHVGFSNGSVSPMRG